MSIFVVSIILDTLVCMHTCVQLADKKLQSNPKHFSFGEKKNRHCERIFIHLIDYQ